MLDAELRSINEEALIIDEKTRTIGVPSDFLLGVESDEDVERIKFQCPKIVGDNIDLTAMRIYINYQNGNGELGQYLCTDVETSGSDITFSWLLSRNVLKYQGIVTFIVCAKKSNLDGTLTNEWNTTTAKGTVLIGLEATEEVVEKNPDVIEQILTELDTIKAGGGSGITGVEVDVDSSTGSPSGTGSVEGGILKLSFSGLSGTNEKNYAASVSELLKVGVNQYVAEYHSLMFVPSADGKLKVGSDNLIGDPYSGKVNPALEPTLIYTKIQNGYSLDWNEDYTGTKIWQNTRFGFSVNLVSGKTYTLSLKTNKNSIVNLYGVNGDETGAGSLIATISNVNGTGEITFIVSSDYNRLRVACVNIPIELTEVTLAEGKEGLIYGGGSTVYDVTKDIPIYISNVYGLNCVGNGEFYASPFAITSLNGIYSNGKAKTYATDKYYVNMGDSIWTFGSNTGGIGNLSDYMIELCGGTWINIATGGTTMANRPGEQAGDYDALDFHALADCIYSGDFSSAKNSGLTTNLDANVDSIVWDDVDYITVAYGTNDLAFGAKLDNSENLYDKNTVCGALRYGIEKVNSKYPNIKFKVCGILCRFADGISVTDIVEWNDGIKKACISVGAEYVDMSCGINKGNYSEFLYDGTHPNANGKEAIAKTLAKTIINI